MHCTPFGYLFLIFKIPDFIVVIGFHKRPGFLLVFCFSFTVLNVATFWELTKYFFEPATNTRQERCDAFCLFYEKKQCDEIVWERAFIPRKARKMTHAKTAKESLIEENNAIYNLQYLYPLRFLRKRIFAAFAWKFFSSCQMNLFFNQRCRVFHWKFDRF